MLTNDVDVDGDSLSVTQFKLDGDVATYAAIYTKPLISLCLKCCICGFRHSVNLAEALEFPKLEMLLSSDSKGDSTMFPLSRDFLMLAVGGAILALSAALHSPYAEILTAWSF